MLNKFTKNTFILSKINNGLKNLYLSTNKPCKYFNRTHDSQDVEEIERVQHEENAKKQDTEAVGDTQEIVEDMYSDEAFETLGKELSRKYFREKLKVPIDYKKDQLSSVINDPLFLDDGQTPKSVLKALPVLKDQTQIDLTLKKQEEFLIPKSEYNHLIKENPHGVVKIINYKGAQLTFVSTYYDPIPVTNLWKIFKQAAPEQILLQLRPDQLLDDFRFDRKNPKTGEFSNRKYVSQLTRDPWELMPSKKIRSLIYNELSSKKVELSYSDQSPEYLEKLSEGRKKLFRKFKSYEGLNDKLLGAAALYGELNNKKIILADLPEIISRKNISHTFTRTQLEEILKLASRETAYHPDLIPNTPYMCCHKMYPEIFIQESDQYISTLIEYMIHKGNKKILIFLNGIMAETVSKYLVNRKVGNLADCLVGAPLKHSIVKDVTIEDMIERNSILDVIWHGRQIKKKFENVSFKSTYSMIEKYGNLDEFGTDYYNQLRYMHHEFIKKYASVCEGEYKKANDELYKVFQSKNQ